MFLGGVKLLWQCISWCGLVGAPLMDDLRGRAGGFCSSSVSFPSQTSNLIGWRCVGPSHTCSVSQLCVMAGCPGSRCLSVSSGCPQPVHASPPAGSLRSPPAVGRRASAGRPLRRRPAAGNDVMRAAVCACGCEKARA